MFTPTAIKDLAIDAQAAALLKLTDDEAIMMWQASKDDADKAKAFEVVVRNEVVRRKFAEHKASGVENVELGNGYKLKATFKQTYKLNNDKDAVEKALSKIEKLGGEAPFIAGRLVKWNPELSLSEYKLVPTNVKKLIDEVITVTDGQPSLALVEPKK